MEHDELTIDSQVRSMASPLIEEGELLVDCAIVVTYFDTDGIQYLRLRGTNMPFWTLNGMLEAAKIIDTQAEDEHR
jgi:hypothetical protein